MIYSHNTAVNNNKEEHFRDKLMLYFNWRNEEKDLLDGFETFESIWSEEYDTIIEPKDRMIEVCRTIDYLNNSDIKAIFSDAKPILEHNQEHFLNFWKRESCKKYFKSLISGN